MEKISKTVDSPANFKLSIYIYIYVCVCRLKSRITRTKVCAHCYATARKHTFPQQPTDTQRPSLVNSQQFLGNEYIGRLLPRKFPNQQRQNCWVSTPTDTLANAANPWTRCLLVGTRRTYFRGITPVMGSNQKATRRIVQTRAVINQKLEKKSQSAWELRSEKTDEPGRPSSCLIVKVIYVWLVKCSNEVA
jgi:hypothetical protein